MTHTGVTGLVHSTLSTSQTPWVNRTGPSRSHLTHLHGVSLLVVNAQDDLHVLGRLLLAAVKLALQQRDVEVVPHDPCRGGQEVRPTREGAADR